MFERSTSHKQLLRMCQSRATSSFTSDLTQKSALTTPLRACLTVTIIHYTGTSHVVALLSSISFFGILWCSTTNLPRCSPGRFGSDLGWLKPAETGMTSWRPILRLGANCLASWDCMGLLQSTWPHLRGPGRVAGPEAPNYGQNECQAHRHP